ncbi:MAG: efflux RND transporter periplasmic adaptor subunit [Chitinophagales bacterium]
MKNATLYLLLAIPLFVASCSSKEEKKEEEVKYEVTTPLKMDTSYTKEYVSQIKSVRNIEIRTQEKGFLQNIYVDEGQYVKANQVLFRIMPKIYEAELMKQQAEVKAAEIELQNAKTLADKNVISKNEQALAQARLDQAKAEMKMAEVHLSFTEIRAPFDGVIDRLPKKLGSLLDEGEFLTSLSDNSQMFAYFNVSEPEYLDYKLQTRNNNKTQVGLLLANNTVLPEKGTVETIEGEFNNETGNIAFRAKFPNPDRLLRHGETGKVLMTIPLKNAIIIPQKATYEIQDKKYVFVVDKNNKVHSKNIIISAEIPDLYVVSDGLNQEDKIVLEGVQKVKDDDKINYTFRKPDEVLAHLRLKAE